VSATATTGTGSIRLRRLRSGKPSALGYGRCEAKAMRDIHEFMVAIGANAP
jgi:hypothetical protein